MESKHQVIGWLGTAAAFLGCVVAMAQCSAVQEREQGQTIRAGIEKGASPMQAKCAVRMC